MNDVHDATPRPHMSENEEKAAPVQDETTNTKPRFCEARPKISKKTVPVQDEMTNTKPRFCKARAKISKKLRSTEIDFKEREKISRFLSNRGFNYEIIKSAFTNLSNDTSE